MREKKVKVDRKQIFNIPWRLLCNSEEEGLCGGIIGDDHHGNDYEEVGRCLDNVTNLAGTRGTGLWDTLGVKIVIIIGGTIIEVNTNIKIVITLF